LFEPTQALLKHWRRSSFTLTPLCVALLHANDTLRIDRLERLDKVSHDARRRASMPRTLDDRIVIADIDETVPVGNAPLALGAQPSRRPAAKAADWRPLLTLPTPVAVAFARRGEFPQRAHTNGSLCRFVVEAQGAGDKNGRLLGVIRAGQRRKGIKAVARPTKTGGLQIGTRTA